MTLLPEVNRLTLLQYNGPSCVPPAAKFVDGIVHNQRFRFCWCPAVTTLQHELSPLLCCDVSLAVVLSFWRRDHNHTDSYRVSMADVLVILITRNEGDSWQCQQYEPLHCHEESVVTFSWVLDEKDYNLFSKIKESLRGHVTTQERRLFVL
jgi:hypothetical protein